MNMLYFLRHSKIRVDQSIPPIYWHLSCEGVEEVLELAKRRAFRGMDFVYSSVEEKAFHTAKIIAESIGKEVVRLSDFNELGRGKLLVQDYDVAVREAFSRIGESWNNWESCQSALARFREGVNSINKKHRNKRVLIVSHGIVLTLYFAHLKGEMNNLFPRWKKLSFLHYGVVKGSTVVRDIVCRSDDTCAASSHIDACGGCV